MLPVLERATEVSPGNHLRLSKTAVQEYHLQTATEVVIPSFYFHMLLSYQLEGGWGGVGWGTVTGLQ